MTLVIPANTPATLLVSAQIRPMVVPTMSRATIAPNQKMILRVEITLIVRSAAHSAKSSLTLSAEDPDGPGSLVPIAQAMTAVTSGGGPSSP
jgi:hypothetical protein